MYWLDSLFTWRIFEMWCYKKLLGVGKVRNKKILEKWEKNQIYGEVSLGERTYFCSAPWDMVHERTVQENTLDADKDWNIWSRLFWSWGVKNIYSEKISRGHMKLVGDF